MRLKFLATSVLFFPLFAFGSGGFALFNAASNVNDVNDARGYIKAINTKGEVISLISKLGDNNSNNTFHSAMANAKIIGLPENVSIRVLPYNEASEGLLEISVSNLSKRSCEVLDLDFSALSGNVEWKNKKVVHNSLAPEVNGKVNGICKGAVFKDVNTLKIKTEHVF